MNVDDIKNATGRIEVKGYQDISRETANWKPLTGTEYSAIYHMI